MSDLDENFKEFVENWDRFRDRLVLFLGAGASIGAVNKTGDKLLSAYELRNQLWTKFNRVDLAAWAPAELKLMSLEHAAAIVEAKAGRDELSKHLVDVFSCDRPLWQHLVLPYLNPRVLFTTNYDELIELGYSRPTMYDVICNDRAPMSNRVGLYKPHGSLSHTNQPVGHGGLVITQFDYLEMIVDYRKMLRRFMTGFDGRCVLFVGYSFGDMDIGAELYSLRKQNSGTPWYAIFPRNDPPVRKMYSKRFSIEQMNLTFEQFLLELDARVDFVPREFKHDKIDQLRAAGKVQ